MSIRLLKYVSCDIGLPCSANAWHAACAENLRVLGWAQTLYDTDVWIRAVGKNEYEYIGTHTDDIICVSSRAQQSMEEIHHVFPMKGINPPKYHLGVDYRKIDGHWHMGTQTHCQEALVKAADILGKRIVKTPGKSHRIEGLKFVSTPMADNAKPEVNCGKLAVPMGANQHRQYQQLMGLAQWLITIGRIDLNFSVISMARFNASPQVGHWQFVERIFGYLNAHPAMWTRIDLRPDSRLDETSNPWPKENNWSTLYSDSIIEEGEARHPKPRGATLDPVVYFDSNFAHDELTRKSVTGSLTMVGRTPIASFVKRQGCIATSTYGAEMIACKVGVEEAIDVRAYCRSLGVPIPKKTRVIGDNLGQLQSCCNPGAEMKKKTYSVCYHFIRENVAVGNIELLKIDTKLNYADFNTKPLGNTLFWGFHGSLFTLCNWDGSSASRSCPVRAPRSHSA